jgi:hypothetical protein
LDTVTEFSQLNWIVEKASELLADKVKDAPLSDRDVDMAFEMFAKSRLQHLRGSFKSELERAQAQDYVVMKLQERANQLNSERWRRSA